jgi:hypothetical protein
VNFNTLVQLVEANNLFIPVKPSSRPGIPFGKHTLAKSVFNFEYLADIKDLQLAVSKPTYSNLKKLEKLAGAKWIELYKFTPPGLSPSFLVKGTFNKDFKGKKLKTPMDVYYYRNSAIMGSTDIYSENQKIRLNNLFKVLDRKEPTTAEEVLELGKILKQRLPKYEHLLFNDISSLIWYCVFVYAPVMRKLNKNPRWKEAEEYIIKNPPIQIWDLVLYAEKVIKGSWPEVEPVIKTDEHSTYTYARDVIKDRWPEGEPTLINEPTWACFYARDVIEGRWPEAEPAIMTSIYAVEYAEDFIKGRWLEAEPYIKNSPSLWKNYTDFVASLPTDEDIPEEL